MRSVYIYIYNIYICLEKKSDTKEHSCRVARYFQTQGVGLVDTNGLGIGATPQVLAQCS